MPNNQTSCELPIGALTAAMRAQEVLARAAIPTYVIKKEKPHGKGRGCIYGLSYSCSQESNLRNVLAHERIKVRQWEE